VFTKDKILEAIEKVGGVKEFYEKHKNPIAHVAGIGIAGLGVYKLHNRHNYNKVKKVVEQVKTWLKKRD
jgi:hypothetical protein